jgi:hypothetical protein
MQHNLNNDLGEILGEIETELDQMPMILIYSLVFFCILTMTIDYKKTDYTLPYAPPTKIPKKIYTL